MLGTKGSLRLCLVAKASSIWVDEQIAPEYHEMTLTVKVDPGENFELLGRLEDRSGNNAPEEGT